MLSSNSADGDELAELLRVWCDGIKPDRDLDIANWADLNLVLTSRGAAEAGPYRTARTPYMRELYRVLGGDHPAQRVVVMKGSQLGFTEAGNAWVGYSIDHSPGPILVVQPTLDLAKRYSLQRLDPMVEASPALRARIQPQRSRDSGNTQLSKSFPGGILVVTGGNSAVGLRSMPVRFLFLDEVDAYPASADDEGDPVALAEARTRTFSWRRKILMISTPTVTGSSRIEREFKASDQRHFFVPCPHCGFYQALEFERLRWEKGAPETAAYVCCECGVEIGEHYKPAMFDAGDWRPTAISADPLTVGLHLSSLYSPIGWLSWAEIARQKEAALGSDDAQQAFVNSILGETWTVTGEAPDWQRLYERREAWAMGTVPAGGLVLTAGADVQRDRIEVSVWAWGRGLESWLVDHVVIDGGPSSAAAWEMLTQLLALTWPHERGADLGIARLAIDSGFEAPMVYAWARQMGSAQVSAIKGVDGFNRVSPVVGPTYVDATESGRKIRKGVKLWTIAVAVFKSESYRWLRQPMSLDGQPAPAGYVHLPAAVDVEWIRQLTAEQLVTVHNRRGFARQEWQTIRERNEALDCRVYARAAAWIVGLHRWGDKQWSNLETQLGIEPGHQPRAGELPPSPSRLPWVRRPAGNWLRR